MAAFSAVSFSHVWRTRGKRKIFEFFFDHFLSPNGPLRKIDDSFHFLVIPLFFFLSIKILKFKNATLSRMSGPNTSDPKQGFEIRMLKLNVAFFLIHESNIEDLRFSGVRLI